MWGGGCEQSRGADPDPGGGERKKRGGHLAVKTSSFCGCCDAGDVIDGQ